MVRAWVGPVLEGVVVIVLVALIVGQVLGQPVLLSYVTTGSMAPTLESGDGFVAVPAQVAGPIEEGDVVVFEATQIDGGGLTTHRVVAETDRGYVTRGDANPFTDQDSGEPPVKDAQIVAVAWQPGGDVLAIPWLGAAVSMAKSVLETVQVHLAGLVGTRALLGAQGLGYLLFGATAVVYAVAAWRDDGVDRDRRRERATGTDARLLVAGFALLVVVAATAAMVVPAGPQQFGVVSAESDSPGAGVIEQGTSESVAYRVPNSGLVATTVYLEPASDGVTVDRSTVTVPGQATREATVTLTAPPDTGYYTYYVTEHRYLAVIPPSTIAAAHEIHPSLPVVLIDVLLGATFYLLGVVLVGTGRYRSRSRDGPSRLQRIRSWSRY